jgi:hypothetical protein
VTAAVEGATGISPARKKGSLEQHTLTRLDSGIRVVTEQLPSVRSIALGKGTMVLTTADPVKVSAKRVVKLGQRKFQIKPQGKKRIKVKLGKKRVRMVKRLRRVKARATIREVDLRGLPRISMRTFTLRGR